MLPTKCQYFDILCLSHWSETFMYSRKLGTFSTWGPKPQILFVLLSSHSARRWREHLSSFTRSSFVFSSEAYLPAVLTALSVTEVMMRSNSKSQCLLEGKGAITTNLTWDAKNKTPAGTINSITYGNEGEWSRAALPGSRSNLHYLAQDLSSNFLLTLQHGNISHCQT